MTSLENSSNVFVYLCFSLWRITSFRLYELVYVTKQLESIIDYNFFSCDQGVDIVKEDFVREQLKSVLSDMPPDVVSLPSHPLQPHSYLDFY